MKRYITLYGPSRELPQKNQSIPVEIQNKGFLWSVLGLFRQFLACSWVVQVVLGLLRGVPFSNDVVLIEFSSSTMFCTEFAQSTPFLTAIEPWSFLWVV